MKIAKLPVYMSILAECFSFTDVFTTCYLFGAIENSLWTANFIVFSICATQLALELRAKQVKTKEMLVFVYIVAFTGLFFCPYMVTVNVPMYYSEYLKDEAANKTYLSFFEGLIDSATTRNQSQKWSDWKNDWLW